MGYGLIFISQISNQITQIFQFSEFLSMAWQAPARGLRPRQKRFALGHAT
jgi:hypothetical protein